MAAEKEREEWHSLPCDTWHLDANTVRLPAGAKIFVGETQVWPPTEESGKEDDSTTNSEVSMRHHQIVDNRLAHLKKSFEVVKLLNGLTLNEARHILDQAENFLGSSHIVDTKTERFIAFEKEENSPP